MLFQFQSTLLALFIFLPLLSSTRTLPLSPHPSSPSHKFDNARTPNVHGFYAIHGVYGARIDRSRDSFSEGGGRKRTATTFGRMADRETKRNRSRPFNVSALSSVIYHRAYITVAGSRNFAFFLSHSLTLFPSLFPTGGCTRVRIPCEILGLEIANTICKTRDKGGEIAISAGVTLASNRGNEFE